jgi:hypothetical protein
MIDPIAPKMIALFDIYFIIIKMSFKKLTMYQTKLLLQRTTNPVLLSFDLGVNSTGVAISD